MDEPIVQLKDVRFAREERVIYKNLTLDIPKGKVTVIMGPSGTGKTTMLRFISGQLKPDSGDVLVRKHAVPRMTRRQLYVLRRKMGILFQQGALFTDLNVFDNVAFPLREHTTLPEDMIHDIVFMKLEAVGLRGAATLKTSELSGGMARRVALARAIAMDPDIMMYDEPFTGQDPIMRGVLIKLIRRLNDALKMTTILVTHDISEAIQLGDKMVIISEGGVVGEGTPDEVVNSEHPAVKQFVKGEPDGVVPFNFPCHDYKEDLFNV